MYWNYQRVIAFNSFFQFARDSTMYTITVSISVTITIIHHRLCQFTIIAAVAVTVTGTVTVGSLDLNASTWLNASITFQILFACFRWSQVTSILFLQSPDLLLSNKEGRSLVWNHCHYHWHWHWHWRWHWHCLCHCHCHCHWPCFHERFFRSLSEWQPEIPWKQLLFQLA